MSRIYDYNEYEWAKCPFTEDDCLSECMLMRPDGWGEPKCSWHVIADELVNISSQLRKITSEN